MANRIIVRSGYEIRPAQEAGYLVLGYNVHSDRLDAPLFAGDLTQALAFVRDRLAGEAGGCTCGKGG
jgi:hypothetical protein